jgi:hypothetical protein
MAVPTGHVLDHDVEAGNQGGILGAERVNRPEVPLLVEQPADVTLDLAPDRFLGRDGTQPTNRRGCR